MTTTLESDPDFEEERVYEVHDWAEVHRLFHREEWTKTRIAEKLGMSRNTVSRLLDLVEPPRYERAPLGSKLDPHKGSILGMLKQDADAPATVIIEYLRRDGYDGGITILKEYLRQVRPLFSETEARQRTTYLPGEIAHTDWWDTRVWVPVGKGASREVFGLVTTLPHSAAHAAVFSFSKTMADFLPAFSGTLLRLGGVSDLNYGPHLRFGEDEFVKAGPGALDGIRKCFGDAGDLSPEDIVRWTMETQSEHMATYGQEFSDLWGRPLQLIDCQNIFCEVDKYARVRYPEVSGRSGRTRIKQRFRPRADALTAWYPPKWGINQQVESWLSEHRQSSLSLART